MRPPPPTEAPPPRAALFLVGPTGAGKTALSLALARRFDLEVVCMDSMQVYQGVPVLTAQPTAEERREVPHHLFASVPLSRRFDAAQYLDACRDLDAARPEARLLFVGGTGLYYNALVDGLAPLPARHPATRAAIQADLAAGRVDALRAELAAGDPEAAARIAPADHRRLERALEVLRLTGRPLSELQKVPVAPTFQSFATLGLRPPRAWLHLRLARRLAAMRGAGLLEEVERLHAAASAGDVASTALQALGVQPLREALDGERPLDEALEAMLVGHRRYARRQETWFRKREEVRWLDPSQEDLEARAAALAEAALRGPR